METTFINRIVPQFDENCNLKGYKFEVFYSDGVVFTDGILHKSFDVCVDSLSIYLHRLYNHSKLKPIVVDVAFL